jgi:hypothetical protein
VFHYYRIRLRKWYHRSVNLLKLDLRRLVCGRLAPSGL